MLCCGALCYVCFVALRFVVLCRDDSTAFLSHEPRPQTSHQFHLFSVSSGLSGRDHGLRGKDHGSNFSSIPDEAEKSSPLLKIHILVKSQLIEVIL